MSTSISIPDPDPGKRADRLVSSESALADCIDAVEASLAECEPAARVNSPEFNHDSISEIDLGDLIPSPENDRLYRPVSPKDPEIIVLAKSIKCRGLLESLVITLDRYIVSGHRRFAAAKLAGLESVPCRIMPIRRTDDVDAFIVLLREHNRQRDKSFAEKLREELVSVDPDDAYQVLLDEREERASVRVAKMQFNGTKVRAQISKAKMPFLAAVSQVLNERRQFWPVSDRQIHYALLNAPPLRHKSKPDSVYRNDLASYKSLVDLVSRARVEGWIDWDCISDETRPTTIWKVYPDSRGFIRTQLDKFLKGYQRDLLSTQPNHVELVVEKNTIAEIVRQVAQDYCVPVTSGRGYCSLPPRRDIVERFKQSGKAKLILLILSDHDPDGCEIAESLARSMRDDFRIRSVHPIRVALTPGQIKQYKPAVALEAKSTSKNFKKFKAKYGTAAYELEAIAPSIMQTIVRQAINAVLDIEAYNQEVTAEKEDAKYLEGVRKTFAKSCEGLIEDEGGAA